MNLISESFDTYKQRHAVNASLLKDIVNGGYDVAYTKLRTPPEPTPAFKTGTLAHALILEGKELFVNAQDTNLRTKEGKQWKVAQEAKGLEVIKREAVADLYGMRDAVEHDTNADNFLKACTEREKTITAKANGIDCKARIDALAVSEDGTPELMCDFKTVANVDDFERDFYKYGYDLQADFYRVLSCKPDVPFVFIAVEKTAPYRVRTFLRDVNELVTSQYFADMLNVAAQVLRDVKDNSRRFYSVSTDYLNTPPPAWITDLREKHLHESLSGLGMTL